MKYVNLKNKGCVCHLAVFQVFFWSDRGRFWEKFSKIFKKNKILGVYVFKNRKI